MKLFFQLIVLCLVAVAVAAPPPPTYNNYNAEILRYENDNIGLGNYRYAFEQSDGTKQEQQGELRNAGLENEAIAVKGVYSWIAPNGYRYTVVYTADDEGYKSEIEEAPGGAPPALVASLLG
ncbi:flexible cuticle protein 12-like isoform X1 [Maniola jurtina]|uniref:flexible cuticle protein 12-like isoform X1 n=1 Tax=Maniola jurtina TaxID=191418 RepID=UPI001E68EEB2|nr:flexible cuticle protein 12-like isoform X1 [Maniola jurtina]XP_045764469.1 flexible cuticle protein 12-like isoform X1 [Maniola jurtina]